ncbi:MAG: DNA gyrase inhibitor YacG [Nitrospirae bacterium]|nr:DNA gyrase inhibitor YacG [Nitrospirota bacterium]
MQVRCPACKKKTTWEENPFKPFCSERCKLIDLGTWASEEYKVPVEQTENEGEEDKDIS